MTNFFKKFKKRIIVFLIGGTALAAGIGLLPSTEQPIEETYFAEIDKNGVILQVIVADQNFINSGVVGSPNNWVQTYKNVPVRKNYAGKGYEFNQNINAFIPQKPTPDAILDIEKAQWVIPSKIETIIASSTTQ